MMSSSKFDDEKIALLHRLHSGVDYSPKGSVDAPITELVNFLNGLKDYVTTSSCSGRISLYESSSEDESKGIHWIYVKHGLVAYTVIKDRLISFLSKQNGNLPSTSSSTASISTVTIKCEPMILHIQCRCHDTAQHLHQVAMGCGFRESGLSLGKKKTMLAIRTTANTMEVPLARYGKMVIPDTYLQLLVAEANKKLMRNFTRIDKLMLTLKEVFRWPLFRLRVNDAENGNAQHKHMLSRWGHSTATCEGSGAITVGGYGVDMSSSHGNSHSVLESPNEVINSNSRAQRGLSTVRHTQQNTSAAEINSQGVAVVSDRVHGSSVILTLKNASNSSTLVLLEYGGRVSPQAAEHYLRLIHIDSSEKNHTITSTGALVVREVGDVPPARWGHSLTRLGDDQCLLLGGRDERQLFSDCYKLHCTLNSDMIVTCTWTCLQLSLRNGASVSPRFFHAAVALNWYRDELLSALSDRPSSDFSSTNVYAEDDHTDKKLVQAALIHGGISTLDDPQSVDQTLIVFPFREPSVEVVWEDKIRQFHNTEQIALSSDWARFGHTITDIGNKCLFLTGGSSTDRSIDKFSALIDLSVTDCNQIIVGSIRSCCCIADENSMTEGNLDQCMPCAKCRVHHTAVSDEGTRVSLFGGGAQCLSFGPHFCADVALEIGYGTNKVTDATEQKQVVDKLSTIEASRASKINTLKAQSSDWTAELEPVIYMRKAQVKRLKIWLEQRSFIDKSRRISDAQTELFTASCLVSLLITGDSYNGVPEVGLRGPLTSETTIQDKDDNITQWMAVPITTAFHSQLLSLSTALNATADVAWINELRSVLDSDSLRVGAQGSRVNKTLLSDGHRRATSVLDEFVTQHSLSAKAKASYPSKYELVGDVLMIPEGAFEGVDWRFLGLNQIHNSQSEKADCSSYIADPRVSDFWKKLANCFSVSRVARKARIHSGPKRESQVMLLYPPVDSRTSSSQDTGPGSRGWVTVVENNMPFSFDIMLVMFCSGNVTERMRMARVKASGQVVVDMYCGIGYYTLPFLVYGGAKHVHACEWNPNSILALRENLRQNNVSERCTIYPGDNALTAPILCNIADRICLGLLPTSTKSWPLAVQIAKPNAVVIIHVHENVVDTDIDTWKSDTRTKFQSLFAEAGKPVTVEETWLERVKSYAPHVYHVVLDLRCTPHIPL